MGFDETRLDGEGATPPEAAARRPGKVGRKAFEPKVREAVVAAARDAMETRGLDGLKARPIADAVGISVGTIYNMFGDLDGLVRAVNGGAYDELLALESDALARARDRGVDTRAQLLALAAAYLDFVKDHRTRWLATLAFNRRQTEPAPRWYRDKELALLGVIEDAIASYPGAQDGEARRLHARALWASIHGVVTAAVAEGFLLQPLDDVWRQIEIVTNAVADALERSPGT